MSKTYYDKYARLDANQAEANLQEHWYRTSNIPYAQLVALNIQRAIGEKSLLDYSLHTYEVY